MPDLRVTVSQRQEVVARAAGCCEYCRSQSQFATQAFSVEHIVPRSRGGQTAPENLALACQGCNAHKHAKTSALDPVTREAAPLYHPREQLWHQHFRWSSDFTLLLGITPTGRATVEALKLNREGLIAMRQVLYARGLHPPRMPGPRP